MSTFKINGLLLSKRSLQRLFFAVSSLLSVIFRQENKMSSAKIEER